MATKIPKTALSLKQFLVRQEVLKLYREILRSIKRVPDEKTRLELREWARTDFKKNKDTTDETAIKAFIYYGRKSLKDLQRSLAIST
ncbi:unnamed protein product [Plutella xylostella]|uniref:LYR motif-containing protein 2 n=1 Tax=Plutella xylostella TaxID=51655 RepID=A0A8S4G3R9_PLUXY|nr:LYR motif-containing protein 2 [Plutella xylostella]CAG9135743.1 unnamed protein product [Plutella xylostella]